MTKKETLERLAQIIDDLERVAPTMNDQPMPMYGSNYLLARADCYRKAYALVQELNDAD